MVEHLEQISAVTEKGRHAVVIMDSAGWHTNDIAEPFDNVSIIKLPPYSPELNLIEQVWSGLRQHYLANPSFSDYEGIVSKVCRAWNGFLECSARVRQMCSRRWIDLTVNFPNWYDMSKMHSLERKFITLKTTKPSPKTGFLNKWRSGRDSNPRPPA